MKCSQASPIGLMTALMFFLVSCGNNAEKTTTDQKTSDSTTATTTTPPAPASTVVTTPQNMMVVTHKVKNFWAWKSSYDAHDSLKLANGVHNYVVGRGVQDSNMVLVATKVDDLNKAKAFAKGTSLKQAMQKGGVIGAPSIHFATMTYQDTGKANSDLRVRSTFTVKDWDAWQKSFEEARKQKTDNGLTVRAYGYDADDNHKVTLVSAITDTAKANAWWKSDELKKRRAASGVIGEPQRFIYRVVQRY